MAAPRRRRNNAAALVAALLLVLPGCTASGVAQPTGQPTEEPSGVPVTAPTPAPPQPPTTPVARTTPVPLEPSEPFGTDVVTLVGDGRRVPMTVYVADRRALRARGLMGRQHLPPGTGMLFTYDRDTTSSFWMRDTLIPLSIAFFDADGAVVGMLDMEPCTTPVCPSYGPEVPYRYALEVPQGWFAGQGIDTSWTLDISW